MGQRPYAPVHLRARWSGADLAVRWMRRSRIGADRWEGEVPLGEASERYRVRAIAGDAVLAENVVNEPNWIWADADPSAGHVEISQISDVWGPGPAARIALG